MPTQPYPTVTASAPKVLASRTLIPTTVQHKPQAVTATLTPPAQKQSRLEPPRQPTTPSPSPSAPSQLWHSLDLERAQLQPQRKAAPPHDCVQQ